VGDFGALRFAPLLYAPCAMLYAPCAMLYAPCAMPIEKHTRTNASNFNHFFT
jgi:hypothetical protein